ncbi:MULTISPECIES: helix-turn-helix domain-containing protein [Pelosinus]|uniref:Helix-turn-helix domain protein n=1 Tax=Pelosinus fermentans B4 TaxID=1149862 RepID=I9LHT9_9FIRM|nr:MULTISPECIES: helix-turn-helix transcriptional regulator [Pelosinus]EIW20089.1 helix-turn-helix domain protein [Pelosinus fermentans B4]EIW26166.1 helix-turn-helix domain protein [Pelosinus fermentans A11]OAM93105.1 helix-turn-helix domain protein [Pelosinus fermentans DSM 17108]SDQ67254.1 Transcriptional regulator, contains XRE-family HTH domain [Pelosinus fermentans]
MTFGERLADLRGRRSLTQNEVAKLTNISRSRLSLYEIGQREPDLATTKQLADFFNVTIDYLVGRDNIESLSPAAEEDNSNDLIKFLEQPEVLFDGIPLTKEDKSKIKASLDIIFWDAKQKNKQKKS